MSAGAAELLHTGREAEKSGGGRRVTRTYKVRTTTKTDSETVALTASGLPAYGDSHPSWSSAKCSRLRAVPWDDENQTLWRVTATYQTPGSGSLSTEETEEDPTARPDEVDIETLPYTEPARKDIVTDEAVDNSAGDPYDPPAEVQRSRLSFLITRNLSSWTPTVATTYVDTVNSATMSLAGKSCAAKTLRMVKVKARKLWSPNGSRYWQVRYEIEYRSDTHVLSLLDQGYRELVTVDGSSELHRMTDDEGKEVQKPVKLDGSGSRLAVGGTSVYLPFDVYSAVSWTPLGLPGSA